MITGLCFIGIMTSNPKMRSFFEDVLGLEVLEENPDRFTYFATDAIGRVELLAPHTNTGKHQHPNRVSVGFLVADLDAAIAQLKASGVSCSETFSWAKDGASQRWVFFRDPDDNAFLLLEQRGDELTMRRAARGG